MDAWVERLQDPDSPVSEALDEREVRGWVNALQNVAALLRQGDYLPGGPHYEEAVRVHGLNTD
jgi:hypothetical protein